MENIASTPKSSIAHNSNCDQIKNSPGTISPISVHTSVSASLEKSSDIIVLSDSDDSDVIIEEPFIETTFISSSSSVESVHDNANMANLILNTSRNPMSIFPKDDRVDEDFKFKWRDVASPSSWTIRMRRYYNKPSKTLKNFDHLKILEEIKDKGTWHILPQDLLPKVGPVKRCSLCRQTDHLAKMCPKRFPNCTMCGNAGHPAPRCPYRMCLNCGRQNNIFIAMCNYCEANRHKVCNECNQVGHIHTNCPNTWRKFYSTTSGEYKEKPEVVNEKLMCCNCGKSGHLFEDCTNLYWSIYPPTSFLVQNKSDNRNKPIRQNMFVHEMQTNQRQTMQQFQNAQRRSMPELKNKKRKSRNNKNPRWSGQHSNPHRHFDSNPQTPQSSKKKKRNNKKKNTKSPNFKKDKQFHKNFTF